MATAARDRLARVLRGDTQTSFSAEMTADMADLSLEVEGFGPVRLPVTPAKARKLLSLGQPARFGRGEQTLTDPDVRDTWEIPRHLVRAEWNDATLKDILATVKEELGLPYAAELTADLHSLLVYEQNQHFHPHQDSEKNDSMIGTLVVTLPSSYKGGELVVAHNGELKAYRGSRAALSLVAFYADCLHEVLEVTSGYRITLTYNLLLNGDTTRPEGDEGVTVELADLLREHFSTPVARYYSGPADYPPNRLVYFLDHEYTLRGLSWRRLKGADADRVALLRAAADKANCEAVLALADIRTTHSAIPDHYDDYRHGLRWDYSHDDDQDDSTGGDTQYEIHELIDSAVALTHWTRPDGIGLEETSLSVGGTEACAATPTGTLTPYQSEYEGYMGNYGNTLDRWYHRAAVAVWPREQAFANRAEASPAWALTELAAMSSADDLPTAQAAAATLAPFWDHALRSRTPEERARPGLFEKALSAADAVADASTAAMLLHPFRVDNLTGAHASSFVKIVSSYGQQWTEDLLRTWFGDRRPALAYGGAQERTQWIAQSLPSLCAKLHATGSAGAAAARQLLDLTWAWTSRNISTALRLSPPSYRAEQLRGLAKPLAAVLTATTATGAADTQDLVLGYIREQSNPVTVLTLSVLRAAGKTRPDSNDVFGQLADECTARLRARLARPLRTDDDWSIQLPEEGPAGGCTCNLCGTLRAFLEDKNRRTFKWPLAKDGRQHVHARIDHAELAVTHVTVRQGRPYTLVLNKTDDLFAREQESRIQDEADLKWLVAKC
jgi:predicted 2-oxoglutarate/Fe(II)-dependent dioxygenase YbiX